MKNCIFLLTILFICSCGKDDDDDNKNSTVASTEHSCTPADTSTTTCTDMHMDAETAQALCTADGTSTFTSGSLCDVAAGTNGCKFVLSGNVEGYSIGWSAEEDPEKAAISCGGESVTKEAS